MAEEITDEVLFVTASADELNVGKMILVYEEFEGYGRGSYTVDWPWPRGYEELLNNNGTTWVKCPLAYPHEVYVDLEDNAVCVRQEGPWTASQTPSNVFTLSDLPVGSKVTVGAETYTVDDGVFEFEMTVAGTYNLQVVKYPYLDSFYEVTYAG